jgi:hypothetical protein
VILRDVCTGSNASYAAWLSSRAILPNIIWFSTPGLAGGAEEAEAGLWIRPGTRGGQPVPVVVTMEITFVLR